MFVVPFLNFLFFFFGDTITSSNISYRVMSGVIFSTDQSVMSLLKYLCIKTEYMPIAAVRLVNIVNCDIGNKLDLYIRCLYS